MRGALTLRGALALAFAAVSTAVAPAEIAAPYVPTAPSVVDRMLQVARVQPEDYVIDLGSGDGRINILAAQRYGARGHGIEIDPGLIAKATANARAAGVADRVSFVRDDLFTTDLSRASVVTIYLLNRATIKLRDRLYALAPGTRIVSHAAGLGEWKADHFEMLDVKDRVRPDAPRRTYLYLWIVPARVTGIWRFPGTAIDAAQACELQVGQQFQVVEGTLRCDGKHVGTARGRLEGSLLRLEIAEAAISPVVHRIEAVMDGEVLKGTLRTSGGAADAEVPWQAARNAAGGG